MYVFYQIKKKLNVGQAVCTLSSQLMKALQLNNGLKWGPRIVCFTGVQLRHLVDTHNKLKKQEILHLFITK